MNDTMSMALPGFIVGIVLGVISGPFAIFGMCFFAPFVIFGSMVAFGLSIFVPFLRPWGVAFLTFSIGLVIGMVINYIVVGLIF